VIFVIHFHFLVALKCYNELDFHSVGTSVLYSVWGDMVYNYCLDFVVSLMPLSLKVCINETSE